MPARFSARLQSARGASIFRWQRFLLVRCPARKERCGRDIGAQRPALSALFAQGRDSGEQGEATAEGARQPP